MSRFKYSVGPWNVHEGADAYGPAVRDTITFEEKIKTFKEIGFDAIQFHDDDAVPNINDYTEAEIIEKAKEVKALLDKYDLASEFHPVFGWTHTQQTAVSVQTAQKTENMLCGEHTALSISLKFSVVTRLFYGLQEKVLFATKARALLKLQTD